MVYFSYTVVPTIALIRHRADLYKTQFLINAPFKSHAYGRARRESGALIYLLPRVYCHNCARAVHFPSASHFKNDEG